jgi:hypothetical protein
VRREITLTQAASWALVLGASVASLSSALLMLMAGHSGQAGLFALGGAVLGLWVGLHVTSRRRERA